MKSAYPDKTGTARPTNQGGYALLFFLAIIAMGVLYSVVSQLDPKKLKTTRGEASQNALAQAKEALLGYASTYRDSHPNEVFGYLPCPDTNGDGTADSCGGSGEAAIGWLPYNTLGLPELKDESSNSLWYIVAGNYKNNPARQPMNWDTRGTLTLLTADGGRITASDDAHSDHSDDANGGAAALVIAPGPQLTDLSFRSITAPCGTVANGNTGYTACTTESGVLHIRNGASTSEAHRTRALPLSPKEIFSRILERGDFKNSVSSSPPGQINTLIAKLQAALESRLWNDLKVMTSSATGTPTTTSQPQHQNEYTQPSSSKHVGDLPDLTAMVNSDINTKISSDYQSYVNNWGDHFRYAVCDDIKTNSPCLSINGQNCRGILLFGGQASSWPRPTARQMPQNQPAGTAATWRDSYLTSYFESGSGLDILTTTSQLFTGNSAYSHTNRAADVGVCLAPWGFVSSLKDLASFTAKTTSPFTPEASINTATNTVVLGNAGAWSSGSGCVWYPTKLPFKTELHAYYRFQIQDMGEGFIFAVADAAKNNPAAGTMCGDTAGSRLGYSGPGISSPKFGVETDTRVTSTRNDPSASHVAFVYWGTTASTTDDNTHNVGTAGSGTQPLNPRDLTASPPGIATIKSSDTHLPYNGTLPLNTDIYVRLDARKSYDSTAHRSSFTLKAYISTVFGVAAGSGSYLPTCTIQDFQDLRMDLNSLCVQNATIEQDDIPMDDDALTGEALANVYIGFTNAQNASSSSGLQSIVIPNVLIRSQ